MMKQLWGVVAAIHGISVDSEVAFLPDPSTVSDPHTAYLASTFHR